MGIVYRVRHLDLDTVLALKIMPRDLSQDAELVQRFRVEDAGAESRVTAEP